MIDRVIGIPLFVEEMTGAVLRRRSSEIEDRAGPGNLHRTISGVSA
jgi:hypothetical protein